MIRIEVPPNGKCWLALIRAKAMIGMIAMNARYSDPGSGDAG